MVIQKNSGLYNFTLYVKGGLSPLDAFELYFYPVSMDNNSDTQLESLMRCTQEALIGDYRGFKKGEKLLMTAFLIPLS